MTESAYTVLGVSRTATEKEILRAYRRAAKRTHPDAGGSAAAFRRAQAAYELLSDPVQRRQLDEALEGATAAQTPPTWAPSAPGPSAAAPSATVPNPFVPRPSHRAKRVIAGVVAYLVLSAIGGSMAPGLIHQVVGGALDAGLVALAAWGLWRVPAVRARVRELRRPR